MDRRASRLVPTELSASRHLKRGKGRGFLIPQHLMVLGKANQTTTAPAHTMINRSRYSLLGFPDNAKLRIVISSFREVSPVVQVNLNWRRKDDIDSDAALRKFASCRGKLAYLFSNSSR